MRQGECLQMARVGAQGAGGGPVPARNALARARGRTAARAGEHVQPPAPERARLQAPRVRRCARAHRVEEDDAPHSGVNPFSCQPGIGRGG